MTWLNQGGNTRKGHFKDGVGDVNLTVPIIKMYEI